MNSIKTLIVSTTLISIAVLTIFLPQSSTDELNIIKKVPKQERLIERGAQEFEQTKDPKTGDVPRYRLRAAREYM